MTAVYTYHFIFFSFIIFRSCRNHKVLKLLVPCTSFLYLLLIAVNLHTNESNPTLKPICLFVNLLLITAATAFGQPAVSVLGDRQKRIDSLKSIPLRLVAQDYYSNNLSFFCKKELQIEKITKVPFRIRLGSLDYVNALEGKGRNLKPLPPAPVPKN
jgi:hypothetical protein